MQKLEMEWGPDESGREERGAQRAESGERERKKWVDREIKKRNRSTVLDA